ncbi:hypothetical protein Poli38472_002754 [Pythium oligandrum]|uniref:ATP synthase subunit b n=1 Tax=Pythium oligandrum TaxID=41045 RepID=A0A8K1CIZ6_PYTOL|nr:hypothetical protein Poli38472_002754 [Pythium oligandrum]|eukprot:TMW63813.1 hypothetical protein Poli38472_002754 [Pythium oligandrum]
MLTRVAFRKALIQGRALAQVQAARPLAAFHTSASRQEEEKAAVPAPVHPGFFAQAGLDDWKVSAPLVAALAIPTLSKGVYVLNEETQLAACFFLFCTSVYKFGGEAIASYFDARASAILSEHNAVEDANIQLAKETLDTHKAMLNIHEDIAAVAEAHKEAVKLMCEVQSYKLRHKTRETFVKNLESIRQIEASYNVELQKAMVANATGKVRAQLEKGDKNVKAAAFKHALDILAEAPTEEGKTDDVAALFAKELRAYAESLESKQGEVITLTAAEQAELQADLDAYMKRFDLEDADFKAAKEIKLELM